MGEKNAQVADAAAKALADKNAAQEAEKQKKEAAERLQALIATPITPEDAKKQIADIEVNRAQLRIIRQKWQAQASQLQLQIMDINARIEAVDERLLALDMEGAVIFRRTLNEAKKED